MLALLACALSYQPGGYVASAGVIANARQPVMSAAPAILARDGGVSSLVDALHRNANRAIHNERYCDALRCYDIALQLPATATPRTFMLKALLLQRIGSKQAAQCAFCDGACTCRRRHADGCCCDEEVREAAQLLQAWGLFEQKTGNADLALALVRAAVGLDGTLSKVLSWRMFKERSHEMSKVFRMPAYEAARA